jgi:hypothetical protein
MGFSSGKLGQLMEVLRVNGLDHNDSHSCRISSNNGFMASLKLVLTLIRRFWSQCK